jgi:hypothetical protein
VVNSVQNYEGLQAIAARCSSLEDSVTVKSIYKEGHKFEGTLLSYVEEVFTIADKRRRANFLCECGSVVEIRIENVRGKLVRSCGCLKKESSSVTGSNTIHLAMQATVTHGLTIGRNRHWLYNRHQQMMRRCYYEYSTSYKSYGAKGIRVCEEWHWLPSFVEWVEAQGMVQQDDFEVHRKESAENYCPENCICLPKAEHRKLEAERSKKI